MNTTTDTKHFSDQNRSGQARTPNPCQTKVNWDRHRHQTPIKTKRISTGTDTKHLSDPPKKGIGTDTKHLPNQNEFGLARTRNTS